MSLLLQMIAEKINKDAKAESVTLSPLALSSLEKISNKDFKFSIDEPVDYKLL